VLFILVIASLVMRYRKGTEQVRNQLLWLILAVLAMLVLNSQRWATGDGPILLLLSFVLIPVAITVAVLRYQLLDIRLVVSRTLLYILVSLIAIAVYAGLVAAVSLLLPAAADRGVAIAAALVVAFGFNPLRIRLQRVIDRAFYGSRGDPVGTATRLGAQLETDDGLDGVLERARDALRLPAITLSRDGRTIASAGQQQPDGRQVTIPLSYRGVTVGELRVALRRGETVLHQADQRVLALLATPLAITLHSVDLAEQIQLSRSAIVSAREEERVRLHRELHDGLGPLLTGAAFRADAVHNVLRTEPDRADILLSQVRAEIRQALGDVRRVVYGLRPLELEELGLIAAVRQRVNVASNGDGEPLSVHVDAPDELPDLSPAVEVAAYRIAVEAVTNVARHSRGANCMVRLRAGDLLTIEVTDDGLSGEKSWKPGVGIRSIVERAEELGGCASAVPTETGGRVFAQLPLA
jgi:signal transduction histidine kinase